MNIMNIMMRLAMVAVVGLIGSAAMADGMIVPVRPEHRVSGSWAVKYHNVNITVRDQVASVSVDQEFVNTSKGMLEVEYFFPVPPGAAIDSMTLVVNGKEYAGQLYKADEARKIYEDIVRTKKDPALLEYVSFGLYRTKAFPLEVGKPAKVVVTYKYVCKKDNDLVEVWYPMNTEKFSSKPIEEVKVRVDVAAKSDITAVYSPSNDIKTDRKDARSFVATFEARNVLPSVDFQLFYKTANEDIGVSLLAHQPDSGKDGYFMLLASPNMKLSGATAAKDVVITLDRSGSMGGDKIVQAKAAAKFILNNLNKADRFNVIVYSDSVEPLAECLQDATQENIDKAIARLDRTDASGATNIDEAMTVTMKMFSAKTAEHLVGEDGKPGPWKEIPNTRPSYAIFLTDGLATTGKTDEKTILENAVKANKTAVRLFALGVGYDVNVRLLDKMVGENNGKSDYAKPNEQIEGKISSLYTKIKNPVMTNIRMEIKGLRVRETYPKAIGDLFEGDQLLVAGRYFGEDLAKLPVREAGVYQTQVLITGTYQGKDKTFEYPVTITPGTNDPTFSFVEKLWATRRIGYLLDQIQLNGQNKEVIDELVQLSKNYGIITPYTSFLADERTSLKARDARAMMDKADGKAKELNAGNVGGIGQTNAMNRQAMNESTVAAAPMATTRAAQMYGYDNANDYEKGKKSELANVRQVGNQSMYKRGEQWVTPDAAKLDPVKDAEKIKVINRYSDEYFELARRNNATENQIMATQRDNEELMITLRGQTYLVK
ncbi:MAG: VWA domain-containing protein [Planctomycetaceae bacterium]|nr:MAG: VWA domain-containing protein [Planctomycetaceae bacterium]